MPGSGLQRPCHRSTGGPTPAFPATMRLGVAADRHRARTYPAGHFSGGRCALSRTSRASATTGAQPSAVSSRATKNATVPVSRATGVPAGRRWTSYEHRETAWSRGHIPLRPHLPVSILGHEHARLAVPVQSHVAFHRAGRTAPSRRPHRGRLAWRAGRRSCARTSTDGSLRLKAGGSGRVLPTFVPACCPRRGSAAHRGWRSPSHSHGLAPASALLCPATISGVRGWSATAGGSTAATAARRRQWLRCG